MSTDREVPFQVPPKRGLQVVHRPTVRIGDKVRRSYDSCAPSNKEHLVSLTLPFTIGRRPERELNSQQNGIRASDLDVRVIVKIGGGRGKTLSVDAIECW